MTEDVRPLLGAYHDGELGESQVRRVEGHLDRCQACRDELAALRRLSAVIAVSPAAPPLTPPERFVSRVALCLPRRPERPAWRRLLRAAWWSVPVLLLLGWAELQAVLLTSSLVLAAIRLGLGGSVWAQVLPGGGAAGTAPVPPTASSGQGPLDVLLGSGLAQVVLLVPLASLVLAIVGAFAYWSWLASWQARAGQLRR